MQLPALIQRVIEDGTASVEDLAGEADLSPHSLYAWARDQHRPRARSLKRLADALERRAETLKKLAGELREAAEREG